MRQNSSGQFLLDKLMENARTAYLDAHLEPHINTDPSERRRIKVLRRSRISVYGSMRDDQLETMWKGGKKDAPIPRCNRLDISLASASRSSPRAFFRPRPEPLRLPLLSIPVYFCDCGREGSADQHQQIFIKGHV